MRTSSDPSPVHYFKIISISQGEAFILLKSAHTVLCCYPRTHTTLIWSKWSDPFETFVRVTIPIRLYWLSWCLPCKNQSHFTLWVDYLSYNTQWQPRKETKSWKKNQISLIFAHVYKTHAGKTYHLSSKANRKAGYEWSDPFCELSLWDMVWHYAELMMIIQLSMMGLFENGAWLEPTAAAAAASRGVEEENVNDG